MKIITLVENKSISDAYQSEHGFSLYIETQAHKILFDLGQGELFLENAKKMGVVVEDVDLVFISHGHYDHGGGLETFLKANHKAKIYFKDNAFDPHYSLKHNGEKRDIGLDAALIENERFVFVKGDFKLNETLSLFTDIVGKELPLEGNQKMLMISNGLPHSGNELAHRGNGLAHSDNVGEIIQDDFTHEQSLLIEENGVSVLIVGCAHSGLVNILKHLNQEVEKPLNYVMGGFHLFRPTDNDYEDSKLIGQMGEAMLKSGAQFYTGHCTGLGAYELLRTQLKERIKYLATGEVLVL